MLRIFACSKLQIKRRRTTDKCINAKILSYFFFLCQSFSVVKRFALVILGEINFHANADKLGNDAEKWMFGCWFWMILNMEIKLTG